MSAGTLTSGYGLGAAGRAMAFGHLCFFPGLISGSSSSSTSAVQEGFLGAWALAATLGPKGLDNVGVNVEEVDGGGALEGLGQRLGGGAGDVSVTGNLCSWAGEAPVSEQAGPGMRIKPQHVNNEMFSPAYGATNTEDGEGPKFLENLGGATMSALPGSNPKGMSGGVAGKEICNNGETPLLAFPGSRQQAISGCMASSGQRALPGCRGSWGGDVY